LHFHASDNSRTLNTKGQLEIMPLSLMKFRLLAWLRKLYEYPLYIDAEEEMRSSVRELALIYVFLVFLLN